MTSPLTYRCIDCHTHVVPENFPAYVGTNASVPWPSMAPAHACHRHVIISGKNYRTVSDGSWSVPRRIEAMGAMRVGRQVLSPMPELLSYWLPADDAQTLLRYLNESIAAMVNQAPAHFIGLGAVPLQDLDRAIRELEYVNNTLGFAGVEIATLRSRFSAPDTIVRVMPNTPAAIGKGVIALFSDSQDHAALEQAQDLMAPLGLVEWVSDESMFDAVTALSGSGPAFLFRFIEALGAAGAAIGLPADQAARFALATVEGAALLAAQSHETPGMLAERVAAPGGSTRDGLDVLDTDCALTLLLTKTLQASERRNAELGRVNTKVH